MESSRNFANIKQSQVRRCTQIIIVIIIIMSVIGIKLFYSEVSMVTMTAGSFLKDLTVSTDTTDEVICK